MKTDSCVILEADSVIKLFSEEAQFQRELAVYISQPPHVSRLLDYGDAGSGIPEGYGNYIRCQRIQGKPYLDHPDSFQADLLGTSIARFHQYSYDGTSALCHIDNQPKNILYDGNGYWLVDFSDSRHEVPEYDLTHLFLFWVEEFPTPHLQHYVISFLTAYAEIIQPRAQAWRGCMIANVRRFDERRGRFNHLARKLPEAEVNSSREWLIDSLEIHKYFLAKSTDVFSLA
ncbi:MAG TPA: phosphotransferase [Candidatus Cloacimonadota bacterium]|nr:phosphotransferase [Candidatus Cloacimonadota bacterium]